MATYSRSAADPRVVTVPVGQEHRSGNGGTPPREQEMLEAERRRADQAEQFAATLARIGAAPDLRAALAVLARDAIGMLRGDGGAVRAYGPDTHSGDLAFWMDRDGNLEPAQFLGNSPRSSSGDSDPSAEGRYTGKAGMRSSIGVPIVVNDRCIGNLRIDHHEEGFFTPADLAVAEALVAMTGAAIERLRLQDLAAAQFQISTALQALGQERDRALAETRAALVERDSALAQARAALELRDRFLMLASHELRTPITSLRGYAQLLLRQYRRGGQVDAKQVQRALQLIDQQSDKLARLAMQLVDTSRIESGKLELERRPTDLVQLIEEIANSTRTMLEATASVTQVEHTVHLDLQPSVIANVDRTRLEHVIVNLIDNSLRYSPNGGEIEIKLSHVPDGFARIEVRDYGIGVPRKYRNRIFERFFQVQRHGNPGGMGLGLYVSRQVVELHGGTIQAEFPEDGGSRFVISLPLEPPNQELSGALASQSGVG
jgi:signal transduction histidine kinase